MIALPTYYPQSNYQTLNYQHLLKNIGAGGGTRTHTPWWTTEFESVSSANSNTPAQWLPNDYNTFCLLCKLVLASFSLIFLLK